MLGRRAPRDFARGLDRRARVRGRPKFAVTTLIRQWVHLVDFMRRRRARYPRWNMKKIDKKVRMKSKTSNDSSTQSGKYPILNTANVATRTMTVTLLHSINLSPGLLLKMRQREMPYTRIRLALPMILRTMFGSTAIICAVL